VSDVAVAALSCHGGCNVVGPVLEALRRAVGADVAGYFQHDWAGRTTALYITPADFWARVPKRPSGLRPFTLTELTSEGAWLHSEMGTPMRPDWGHSYQLVIPVTATAGGRESRVWVLLRADRDFTSGDRDLASATRDVLEVVSRHAECREQRRLTARQPTDPLTERELLVLQLLEDGLTAQAVAAQLGIATRTVQKHTEHIYRKLRAHDRHSALQAAAELTLLAH
jgi:DNA-binding CsgD family transcriptional regulator